MIRNHLLLCFFGISATILSNVVAREAIIGGRLATEGQFPYQVSLQVYGRHVCGGGILYERFILTAAHCIYNSRGERHTHIEVVAGTIDVKNHDKSVIVEVEKVYLSTDYDDGTVKNAGDIAVLKLEQPLTLSHGHLEKVKLPHSKQDNHPDKTATIAGFGWNWVKGTGAEREGNSTDGRLRYAHVDVVSNECLEGIVQDKHLCGQVHQPSRTEPGGTCPGDSGGLLVHEGIAIGVLSSGPKTCVEKDRPAIYTRVSHYLTFIRNAKEGKVTKNMHEIDLMS